MIYHPILIRESKKFRVGLELGKLELKVGKENEILIAAFINTNYPTL